MSEPESVDELVTRGEYARAATVAAAAGDLRRAIQLYERIWRFADAVPLALAAGERALAVRLAIAAGDLPGARAIAAQISVGESQLSQATEAFAHRGHHHDAAALAERAGSPEAAAAHYQKAGAWLQSGRCLELAGRFQEAGKCYERMAASAHGAQAAEARLALGRLLGALGRHKEAARALQSAARHPGTAVAAQRRLVAELMALGHGHAAAVIAARVRVADPTAPVSADDIARAELHQPREGDDSPQVPRRFRVLRSLGGGAQARVYAAQDQVLGREVALKVLGAAVGISGPERQAFLRFVRESEAAGRLRHPNIVTVHEVDEAAGVLVLEFLPGGTLAEQLERTGPLTLARARRLGLELCAALTAAHQAGIVHRDMKPANVFQGAAGNAKLGDFGAAHLLDFGQTQTGGFIGTLAYLAPEQITGSSVGPATDVYALGVTLYESLVGRPPFLGPDLVGQHLSETPLPPSQLRGNLGPAHDEVLLRALAKAPADRFASAATLAEAIARWPADSRPPPEGLLPAPHLPEVAALGPDLAMVLGRTARGVLAKVPEPRTGRFVLQETLDQPLDAAGWAAVRRLAAQGGPQVQRVLSLDPAGQVITYEFIDTAPAPGLSPTAAEAELIAAAGVPDARVAHTAAGSVVLVQPPLLPGNEELGDE